MSKPPKFKYQLSTVLKFGKWKGYTIEQLINRDPNYLHWCIANVDGFELDNKAYKLLPDETENEEYNDAFRDAFDFGDN